LINSESSRVIPALFSLLLSSGYPKGREGNRFYQQLNPVLTFLLIFQTRTGIIQKAIQTTGKKVTIMEPSALSHLKTHATLKQIITAEGRAELLFRSIGIQPELNEDKTLLQVCAEKQLNEEELLAWLRKETGRECEAGQKSYEKLSRSQLASLYRSISGCLKLQLEEVSEAYQRVCKVHGIQYPVLKQMHWHLGKITEKVRLVMMLADRHVMPMLNESNPGSSSVLYGKIRQYRRSVNLISQDQPAVATHIGKNSALNSHPEQIEGACSTIKIVMKDLDRLFFEIDTLFSLLQKGVIPNLDESINRT
jgi:iron-sulfur cluster repair protein YtfE (RIC family)